MSIIAAAVKFNKDGEEFIIMGKRHHNCFEIAYQAGLRRPWEDEQGFMTDKFDFLNRYEAFNHAVNCYQLKSKCSISCLYSEDLW